MSASSVTENIRHRTVEHQLIDQVRQGDTAAFAKLFDKYAPVLLGVTLKITGDKKTAEELLQKSFMRFWKEISAFDPGKGSLLTWMLSITRQIALAAVSQKNKTGEIQSSGNSVNTSNPGLTPERAGAVIHFPQHDKQLSAVDMVYFKGYSLVRAAGELNITVADLKKRIRMEFKTQGGKKL